MAAGYATRLYPLTKNFPKPLLQISDNTILGRLLDDIDTIPEISGHIIVTNHKFAETFRKWATERKTEKSITIIDDGTETNETRLGAVRDLLLAIDRCNIDEDILVIAADNILDFSFKGFVDHFKQKQTSLIMCHYEPEIKRLQRTGVIKVDNDENLRVLEMQEKPEQPASHWAVPPFYLYKRSDLPLIKDCVRKAVEITAAFTSAGHSDPADGDSLHAGPAHILDAPGSLIKYLCPLTPIHAWRMPGRRFDIGSLDSYEEAKVLFGDKGLKSIRM